MIIVAIVIIRRILTLHKMRMRSIALKWILILIWKFMWKLMWILIDLTLTLSLSLVLLIRRLGIIIICLLLLLSKFVLVERL